MGKLAEVLNIKDYTSDPTGGDILKRIEMPTFRTTTSTATTTSSAFTTTEDYFTKQIPIRELYPLANELKPALGTALHLLEEGLTHINVATNMLIEGDLVSSDDAIQRFQALLPELFCCRTLGDGFGAIVNAIFQSLKNLEGIPANIEQLGVIRNITNRILTEPFISFEEAVDEIILFETVGLISESSHFKYAADLLVE